MQKLTNNYAALLLTAAMVVPQSVEAKKKTETFRRPNVILINLDDMGYGDPSCYGNKLIETPNIDRIAAEGIRCTDGYVSAPVSGVSRMGLLTGSYQQRYGLQWNHDQWDVPGDDGSDVLPTRQRQIQSAFKEAGYVTAMAGKIGIKNDQPFDKKYSYAWNGVSFFPDDSGRYAGVDVVKGEKKAVGYGAMLWGPEREGDEYLTDRCTRQCIEFIEENKEKPFFFYLAYNAPHSPLHAKKSDKPRVAHIKSEVAQLYNAMVLSVDDNVGKILNYLDKEKLREDTIIVFLSDNGPANPFFLRRPQWWPEGLAPHYLGQRGGLNGNKGTMWDAGIRVPYIISWRGKLPEGKTYTQSVSTLDIYPTLCSAAHIRVPSKTRLDGVDLMPYMMGDYDAAPHDYLYWYANRMGAVRSGQWKMLINDDYHYLFDMSSDAGETKNVMRQNPEVMKRLLDAFVAFRSEMPPYRNPYCRPIDIPSEDVKNLKIEEIK